MADDPISFFDLLRDLLERLPTDPLAIVSLAIVAVAFIAYLVLPRDGVGGFGGRMLFGIVTIAAVVVLAWRATVIGVEIQIDRFESAAETSLSG